MSVMELNGQPAPAWDEPIDMLYACHGKIKRFCGQLRQLPDYLAGHGCNRAAREAAAQVLNYFDRAAPLHHRDEEDDFFPALLRHAPQAQADLDDLARQHAVLEQAWQALRPALAAVAEGGADRLDGAVVARFIEAYARHIGQEEPWFELGRRLIPTPQLQEIGRIMAARRRG